MELPPAMMDTDTEALLHIDQEQGMGARSRGWRVAAIAGASAAGLLMGAALLHTQSTTHKVGGAALGHLTGLAGVAESADYLQKETAGGFTIYTSQTPLNLMGSAAKPKRWVVNLPQDASKEEEDEVIELFGDSVVSKGETIRFLVLEGTIGDLKEKLEGKTDLKIQFVEQDVMMKATPETMAPPERRLGKQDNPTWGLDRTDDRSLPLDNTFEKSLDGRGAHVYVFDTGINVAHEDFGGRAIPTLEVLSNRPKECDAADTKCANDVQGHGTHCAGTIGGTKYGVAKHATIHAVKILGDHGEGSFSWLEMAMDWVISNGQKPSIISASLGGRGNVRSTEVAMNVAVDNGVVVVVAAGNENDDACSYTPAYIPKAITVGSTRSDDRRSVFSNKGNCLDIFAPGTAITSAGLGTDNHETFSGTSMACPHVAGAAALYMADDHSLSPEALVRKLQTHASPDMVHDTGRGSPNLLLFVGDGEDQPVATTTPVAPPSDSACHAKGWQVTSGDCTIDKDCCLLSPNYPEDYPNDAACTVRVGTDPGPIHQESFATEWIYDSLTVGGLYGDSRSFSADTGPHDYTPLGEITFSSDDSVAGKGFKLCLPEIGSCPEDGWRPAKSCLPSFKYDGETYQGCTTKDHDGNGWCATHDSRALYLWADCIQCS